VAKVGYRLAGRFNRARSKSWRDFGRPFAGKHGRPAPSRLSAPHPWQQNGPPMATRLP